MPQIDSEIVNKWINATANFVARNGRDDSSIRAIVRVMLQDGFEEGFKAAAVSVKTPTEREGVAFDAGYDAGHSKGFTLGHHEGMIRGRREGRFEGRTQALAEVRRKFDSISNQPPS